MPTTYRHRGSVANKPRVVTRYLFMPLAATLIGASLWILPPEAAAYTDPADKRRRP